LIGAAAIIVVIVAWLVLSHQAPVTGIEASGTIEATESDLSPKVQGRLAALRVRDGDVVKTGQTLAVLERLDPTLDLDQARANVATAVAQVASAQAAYNLQQTTYSTTLAQAREGVAIAQSALGQAGENLGIETNAASISVDQAQAQLVAARSAYQHAQTDLARARNLVGTGDLARQALDDAMDANASAAAQLQAARDALALAQANRRNVQIRQLGVRTSRAQQQQSVAVLASARAEQELVVQRGAQVRTAQGQLAQARAAFAFAQDQVRETQLVAPFDGYVISHNFEVGDLIQPGSAVMTIGDLTHPYLYVYVSETDLPHVKTGAHVDVSIDGIPGRTFAGAVTEISNTAEFTPENVQTKEERIVYLVFRVKIQFTDTTGSLKAGLPADAVIHT
jgi:HlyD family secretion protein